MNIKKLPFKPANILLPKVAKDVNERINYEQWAVIACDQFTSDKTYWNELEVLIADQISTLHMILPEIYLEDKLEERIQKINETMDKYLEDNVFVQYDNALIYVERMFPNGQIRRGIIGAVDLEEYDFIKGSETMVRATEETVVERIPPRVKIRKSAPIEVPHVIVLIDDIEKNIIEGCQTDSKIMVYDFQLSMGGGNLRGYVLSDEAKDRVLYSLCKMCERQEHSLCFAVGDGNHSLATAKTCYEYNKTEANRYALVEMINIHDNSIEFEPIYRVMFDVDVADILSKLGEICDENGTQEITFWAKDCKGILKMKANSALTVGTLQNFIDNYINDNPTVKLDYVHGIEETLALANRDNTISFIFEGMEKEELFPSIVRDGVLPRKTFSMGDALSKRYYMECRKIDKCK